MNFRVLLMSSEVDWISIFLVEHCFGRGPLDRKRSDTGDRIGVGAIEGIVGCDSAKESTRGWQIVRWNDRDMCFASADGEDKVKSHAGRQRRYDHRMIFISVSQRTQPCQLPYRTSAITY